MQAVAGRRKTHSDDYERTATSNPEAWHAIAVVAIAVAAFAIRYWFNFFAPHINNYGSCDGSEYLRNAQALSGLLKQPPAFWQDCWNLLGQPAAADAGGRVQQVLASMKEFSQGGIVFPMFIAASYLIVGLPVDIANSTPPLVAQCIISALTCGFIAGIGSCCFSKPTGYLAGILAALYPAFIINSGRLYSETFAAFLLSAAVYCVVRGLSTNTSIGGALALSFWSGVCAAALQLTRSIMVFVSAALVPLTFVQYGWKRGTVALFSLLVGAALVLAPWFAFTKLAFGKGTLLVDRVGNYNVFIGNNTSTSGWLSFPYPDGTGINEKTLPQLLQQSVEKNPRRWFQLLLDKPLRLFKFPWNDFRTPVGAVTFRMQVVIHQMLLLFGLIGATLGFLSITKTRDPDFGYERRGGSRRDATNGKLFLLFVFAIHFAYLFFITVPRYNLTAMPVVIVFAAAGLGVLLNLLRVRNGALVSIGAVVTGALLFIATELNLPAAFGTAFGNKAVFAGTIFQHVLSSLSALALIAVLWYGVSVLGPTNSFERRRPRGSNIAFISLLVAALILLPVLAIPATANGPWYEWRSTLDTPGQAITQEIVIPPNMRAKLRNRQMYLLFDTAGAAALSGATIEVNGRALNAPVIPSISLIDDFGRMQHTRGVVMREGEWVFSSLTESADIRNADLRQWFLVPIEPGVLNNTAKINVTVRKHDLTPGTIFGAYTEGKPEAHIPSLTSYSWEKAFFGVENPDGFSDTRYTTRIPSASIVASSDDLSHERGLQSGSYNIRLLVSPEQPRNTTLYTVELQQPQSTTIVSKDARSIGVSVIPDRQRTFSTTFAHVPAYSENEYWLVRVRGAAKRNAGAGKLGARIYFGYPSDTYSSPWFPTIEYGTNWKHFDAAVPIQPATLGQLKNIRLEIQTSAPSNDTTNGAGFTDLKDMRLEILKLPTNPVNPGHTIL